MGRTCWSEDPVPARSLLLLGRVPASSALRCRRVAFRSLDTVTRVPARWRQSAPKVPGFEVVARRWPCPGPDTAAGLLVAGELTNAMIADEQI